MEYILSLFTEIFNFLYFVAEQWPYLIHGQEI